ncbi:hypothetical protein LZ554_004200 [Drepanopeziza brunnea f. sp. 'monogermtubi']|nr:hypothetical protein LZ554_004200 [Drepanopeziza brunnea f. sp. 'monogermtubi']
MPLDGDHILSTVISIIDKLDRLRSPMDFIDDEDDLNDLDLDMDDVDFDIGDVDLGLASKNIDDIAHRLSQLTERWQYDGIAAASPLTMASGTDAVLTADKPFSIEFFRSLPADAEGKYWGVYAVIMDKTGCSPELYISSSLAPGVESNPTLPPAEVAPIIC